jgi:hypothetical protein
MKIGISGAVGIGKTYFVNTLDNSIFLGVEEAARNVNAMYPERNIEDLREIIFHHQLAVEDVIDKLAENVIAVCDRTVIDNMTFIKLFDNGISENEKNSVKAAYANGLKKYDELYYLDYGNSVDPILLEIILWDKFRKKTLGDFASDVNKFMDFNKKFKEVFLKTAAEFEIPVKVIETDYDEYSLNERNKALREELLNNFLGV